MPPQPPTRRTWRAPSQTPLELAGVPHGLTAFPEHQWREQEDGTRVPIGHRVLGYVLRAPDHDPADVAASLASLDPADRRFLLGAPTRRWATIARHFGNAAHANAIGLARAGLIDLHVGRHPHQVLAIGPLTGWQLTPTTDQARTDQQATAKTRAQQATATTRALVDQLERDRPHAVSLIAALRAPRRPSATLDVLCAAARSLLAGDTFDTPRAFSQHHFGATKAVHADQILADAGVEETIRVQLGVRRGSELGFSGPVTILGPHGPTPLTGLWGPITIQAAQPTLCATAPPGTRMVVVENKHAAISLGRNRLDLAVIYTAGCLGADALRLVEQLAACCPTTLVVCDADLGGVRIAAQLLAVARHAHVVDIGGWPHPTVPSWTPDSVSVRELHAYATASTPDVNAPRTPCRSWDGPTSLSCLARAALARGYPVEQELSTLQAINDLIQPS
jgi:hypothetical protein